MLKRIYIHNYRTFVNFEWSPPKACVLVGENGSGKSSFFEVLGVLGLILLQGQSVDDADLRSTRTAWLQEQEQVFTIELENQGQCFEYRLSHYDENGIGTLREELSCSGRLIYRSVDGKVDLINESDRLTPRMVIPFDRQRSFIAVIEPQENNHEVIEFRKLFRSIWTVQPDPRSFQKISDMEVRGLRGNMSNFVDWYRMRVGEDLDAALLLRKDLQDTLNGFVSLRLETLSLSVKELRVLFSFGQKTHEIRWSQLSDGQKLLIALYGLFRLGFNRGSTFVLDEIENYVAPKEIQPFLRKLLDASAEAGKQVIVISHHPESINYLAADSIWRMWRDPVGGHTRIAKVEADLDSGETAYDLVKRGEPDA